jgi:hypothetical protein
VIWTRSANSHTGRRLSSCRIKGRTDDSIRPRATTTPTFSLARTGASTDGKLASVLALAPRTTAGLIITIKGTCIEAVDQVPGNVTLQGASSGDGLEAPAASSNPVLGISGSGVTLDNLTLSGGVHALWVHSGASAIGTNLEIEGSSAANVLANGIITLNSSNIENSGGHGIDVLSAGTVFLNGGTVRNNARGLQIGNGSYLLADGGVVIASNTGSHGAEVAGSLSVRSATIENNSPDGINISFGGSAALIGGNLSVVRSNARDGGPSVRRHS